MKKIIKVTEKDIENITTDYWFVVEPTWEKGNIYETFSIYENSLSDFTLSQRYLYAIEWLFSEVSNGGFYQFFDNSTGIVWEDAYKGFEIMKCNEMTTILDKVLKLYGKEPSKIREERWKEIEKFYDGEISDKLDNLSREFYKINDSLYPKIIDYIKTNTKEFIFEGEIDIE